MGGIFLVFVCIGIGLLLKHSGHFTKKTDLTGASNVLNAYVISVALPSIVIKQMHQMALHPPGADKLGLIWIPISMPWILFGVSVLSYWVYTKALHFSKAVSGALVLTVGLGNTSFVGFPLLEAIFGKDSLQTGVLVDQPGSFLILSTAGVVFATLFGSSSKSTPILRRVFTFPPFLALLGSVFLGLCGVEFSTRVNEVLDRLGQTLVPVALISVGLQLNLSPRHLSSRALPLGLGLFLKLIVVPGAMALLYLKVLPNVGRVSEIVVIESAMAPMITGGILASEAGFDSELSSLMVGTGILISLITVPLWAHVLGFGT